MAPHLTPSLPLPPTNPCRKAADFTTDDMILQKIKPKSAAMA